MASLSPLDGRYKKKVEVLCEFFSEEALMGARVEVEIEYFIALSEESQIKDLPRLKKKQKDSLFRIIDRFGALDAKRIKSFERKTNHDVKAVEYYLKEKAGRIPGLKPHLEFIHFGLTSEDVNNLAYGLLIHRALKEVTRPTVKSVIADLNRLGRKWQRVPMLSLTHGQPATPTVVGEQLFVFADRLERQFDQLKVFKMSGKFGGAVANYAAHRAAYPNFRWESFGRKFVRSLGLQPMAHTTQINPHDDLAELSHIMFRIDTILIDLSRDAWQYISRGIFKQKTAKGEVGSSTMPHKVNPIDFENAEGNLGVANALFSHFAEKLPISRLQRDLSDSTVQRNIGVAFGYHYLAMRSLRRGLSKISLDKAQAKKELDDNPEVLAEAVQMVLRKNGVSGAYEKMKKLTRGKNVTKETFRDFAKGLDLPKKEKDRLLALLK